MQYKRLLAVKVKSGPQKLGERVGALLDRRQREIDPGNHGVCKDPKELERFFDYVNSDNLHRLDRLLAPGFPFIDTVRGQGEKGAVQMSVAHGHLDILRCLLDRGANPNIQDFYGQVPLSYAWDLWDAARGEEGVQPSTLKRELSKTALMIGELLSHGANPNIPDLAQKTPMHRACYNGHTFIAMDLMKNGALDDVPDRNGNTPLALAIQQGQSDTVRVIRQWSEIKVALMGAEYHSEWLKFLRNPEAILMSSKPMAHILTDFVDEDNSRNADAQRRDYKPIVHRDDLTAKKLPGVVNEDNHERNLAVLNVVERQIVAMEKRRSLQTKKVADYAPSKNNRKQDGYVVRVKKKAAKSSLNWTKKVPNTHISCRKAGALKTISGLDLHRGWQISALGQRGRKVADDGYVREDDEHVELLARPKVRLNPAATLPPHADPGQSADVKERKKFADRKLHVSMTNDAGKSGGLARPERRRRGNYVSSFTLPPPGVSRFLDLSVEKKQAFAVATL